MELGLVQRREGGNCSSSRSGLTPGRIKVTKRCNDNALSGVVLFESKDGTEEVQNLSSR